MSPNPSRHFQVPERSPRTSKTALLSIPIIIVITIVLLSPPGKNHTGGQSFRVSPVSASEEDRENTILNEGQAENNPDVIKIASFNIQVFGRKKASKKWVMEILAKTISGFDIVAIQEIRDATGTAIEELEREVDALGEDYGFIISPRLGRTSSKEQYAYMYRENTVEPMHTYTYEDTAGDLFHREPYIARFRAKEGPFDLVLITIHTDPDEATQEINALVNAVKDAERHFPDEEDFIILGDLNADCKYFDESDMKNPLRIPEFTWIIVNAADTNLAKSKCTYDRIILTSGTAAEDLAEETGVFRFDTHFNLSPRKARKVSDHYPVYTTFHINRDTD